MGHFRNNEPTLEDIHEKAKGIYASMSDEEIIDKYAIDYEAETLKAMHDDPDRIIRQIESEL